MTKPDMKMPPAVAPAEGEPNALGAIDNRLIAYHGAAGKPENPPQGTITGETVRKAGNVAYRTPEGRIWRYSGKRARVLAMLATRPAGLTQWDTLPWHTRLGGTIHAMRRDGLAIITEIEGRYRHARYRLATPGSVIIQGENRDAGQ